MPAYSRSSNLAAYQSVAVHGGVAAADPHRLIVMLMDGALERIAQARCAIQGGSKEAKAQLLHRTVAILGELRASLNFEAGGDLAQNLSALYDYCTRQVMKANLDSSIEILDEVSNLIREVRSAWILLPQSARPPAP